MVYWFGLHARSAWKIQMKDTLLSDLNVSPRSSDGLLCLHFMMRHLYSEKSGLFQHDYVSTCGNGLDWLIFHDGILESSSCFTFNLFWCWNKWREQEDVFEQHVFDMFKLNKKCICISLSPFFKTRKRKNMKTPLKDFRNFYSL